MNLYNEYRVYTNKNYLLLKDKTSNSSSDSNVLNSQL